MALNSLTRFELIGYYEDYKKDIEKLDAEINIIINALKEQKINFIDRLKLKSKLAEDRKLINNIMLFMKEIETEASNRKFSLTNDINVK